MASQGRPEGGRQRGSIRRHRDALQVRVSAGKDPVTGDRIVLTDSVVIERPGNERSERAAWKEAEKLRTRLLAEADSLKVARTKSTFGALLDQWLPQAEIDPTTRMNYEWIIRDHIRPVLGDVPLVLLLRDASERLERFYADLRRCRQRCDGKPFVEHRVAGPHECREMKHRRPSHRPPAGWLENHDCVATECETVECRMHKCKPYAASSVRSVHAIISGALSAAVRWNRIPYNPAPAVRLPAKRKPQPRPWVSGACAVWRPDLRRGGRFECRALGRQTFHLRVRRRRGRLRDGGYHRLALGLQAHMVAKIAVERMDFVLDVADDGRSVLSPHRLDFLAQFLELALPRHVLERRAEVVGHSAHLADETAQLTQQFREVLRTDDDQRNRGDDDELTAPATGQHNSSALSGRK